MHDDRSRLEWYDCRECGLAYTWFNIVIMDGVSMYGWLHLVMDEDCIRDRGMAFQDIRDNMREDGDSDEAGEGDEGDVGQ